MEEQEENQNKEELLKNIRETMKAAEALDTGEAVQEPSGEFEEETSEREEVETDIDIESSLNEVLDQKNKTKDDKYLDMVDRAAKKRKGLYEAKKKAGIRPGKQSKYPTRSDEYLKPGLTSLHVVLYNKESEVYKDGADFAPRMIIGTPAYGKTCKLNAYERLIKAQEKIRETIGDKNSDYPNWVIISNDSSMIMDRNILSRLAELKEQTHCVGAYGFESIRADGKWFSFDNQEEVRGAYIQGDMNTNNWDHVVGFQFKNQTRFKIVLVHGPFIAIRGMTFMKLDFKEMAKKSKWAFHHYMAHISLECVDRGYVVGTIKTVAMQFDKIQTYFNDPNFIHDQGVFVEKWRKVLPMSIRGSGR